MKVYRFIILLISATLLVACNLEKEIEVALPNYENKMVVEAYLIPGKPFKLLLTNSLSYFETPQFEEVKNANVVLNRGMDSYTLTYINPDSLDFSDTIAVLSYLGNLCPKLIFDIGYYSQLFEDQVFFNYFLCDSIQTNPGDIFSLRIEAQDGRILTGQATVLNQIPIDTIRQFDFDDSGKTFVLTSFTEQANADNYYRYVVHRNKIVDSLVSQDFQFNDALFDGEKTDLGTPYDFEKGDTVIVTLYHVSKDYYHFIETVDFANAANGNPFAQPAIIKSTVDGGIGVFTVLSLDRKTHVIK